MSTKTPEQNKKYCSTWYYKHKNEPGVAAKIRARRLKTKYGITPKTLIIMQEDAGGRCTICKREKVLEIDHCHKTLRVRGLLCHSCNTKLAWFEKYQDNILEFINLAIV